LAFKISIAESQRAQPNTGKRSATFRLVSRTQDLDWKLRQSEAFHHAQETRFVQTKDSDGL